MSRHGRVSLVGSGPGDPGLLTLRAVDALRSAAVLLYDALVAEPILAFVPEDCERIYVGKRGGAHAMAQSEIESLMIAKAREGKRVVRLKGGDPFVFGRGGEEAQRLHAAGIAFDVVPGISSAIAAPAYAGIPVTHRDANTAFTVATGHEDPTKGSSTIDWQRLADPHRTLVLLMSIGNLGEIAARLCEAGLAGATPVAVVQDGTRPSQRTVVGTLASIADDVARAGVRAPAVVVVGEVVALRQELRWFDALPLFGKRVLVTRPQHQADDFADALLVNGAQPICRPTIAIAPPHDVESSRRAIQRLSEYAWVVFSSRNGVDAMFAQLDELKRDARAFGACKAAAIGPATAQALHCHGVRADLVPASYVSEELAQALIAVTQPGERILIYRAQEARDALPRLLNEHGREVEVVAGYSSVVRRHEDFVQRTADADILTFTSAGTVAGFVANFADASSAAAAAQGKVVACIGPITAAAARDAGLPVTVVAADYTVPGLLAALQGACSSPA
ncbi:MAG: uroporphyrinogen-III C-methyltransferase [Vulcanimicrobiaceae bacterium]